MPETSFRGKKEKYQEHEIGRQNMMKVIVEPPQRSECSEQLGTWLARRLLAFPICCCQLSRRFRSLSRRCKAATMQHVACKRLLSESNNTSQAREPLQCPASSEGSFLCASLAIVGCVERPLTQASCTPNPTAQNSTMRPSVPFSNGFII